MNVRDRLYGLFRDNSFLFPVWMTSLLMVAWGGWVILPFTTFNSGPAFETMEALASEFAWGAMFIVVGFVELKAAMKLDYRGIAAVSLIAGYLWLVVAMAFLAGDFTNTGWIVYMFLALVQGWAHTISKNIE